MDGRAQQGDENRRRAVTFADARATAEAHAPDVTLSERRDDIARTQADVAGALANPTVTVLTVPVSPPSGWPRSRTSPGQSVRRIAALYDDLRNYFLFKA